MPLNPTIDPNIGYERPVEGRVSHGGLATATGFLSAAFPLGGKSAPSGESVKRQTYSSFWERINDLQSQNLPAPAYSAGVRQAARGVLTSVGEVNEEIKTFVESVTGVSLSSAIQPDSVAAESSIREKSINDQIRSSPDYQQAYLVARQQNPHMDHEKLEQEAMNIAGKSASNKLLIQRANEEKSITWDEMQPIYEEEAANYLHVLQSHIESTIMKDGVTSVEEMEELRRFYETQIFRTKPINVSTEDWAAFEAGYLVHIEAIVKAHTTLSKDAGAQSLSNHDNNKAFRSIIAALIKNGELPPTLAYDLQTAQDADTLVNVLTRMQGEGKFEDYAENIARLYSSTLDELFEWATGFSNQTDFDSYYENWDASVPIQKNRNEDNEAYAKRIQNSITNVVTSDDPAHITRQTAELFAYMDSMASAQLYITPDTYNKVFGPDFWKKMDKVIESNPIVGQQIVVKAQEIIGEQLTNGAGLIQSMTSQGLVQYDEEGKPSLNVSVEGFIELSGGKGREEDMALIQEYYGGDLTAAINDGGKKLKHLLGTTQLGEDVGVDRVWSALKKAKSEWDKINSLYTNWNKQVEVLRTVQESFKSRHSDVNIPSMEYPTLWSSPTQATLVATSSKSMPTTPIQGSYPVEDMSVQNVSNWIREVAQSLGIDPEIAVRVAKSEGLTATPEEGWQSYVTGPGTMGPKGREDSWGPFQLLIRHKQKDGKIVHGVGKRFMDETGLDPRDPSTWKEQVVFALKVAKEEGWGQWYGAAKNNISRWEGINRDPLDPNTEPQPVSTPEVAVSDPLLKDINRTLDEAGVSETTMSTKGEVVDEEVIQEASVEAAQGNAEAQKASALVRIGSQGPQVMEWWRANLGDSNIRMIEGKGGKVEDVVQFPSLQEVKEAVDTGVLKKGEFVLLPNNEVMEARGSIGRPATAKEFKKLSPTDKRAITNFGYTRDELLFFNSDEEAEAALYEREIDVGDVYITPDNELRMMLVDG